MKLPLAALGLITLFGCAIQYGAAVLTDFSDQRRRSLSDIRDWDLSLTTNYRV